MSMSPLNGVVLGAAAIVSSPALWLTVVEGSLPLGDALTRYLISVLVCWVALNVVAQLAFPAPQAEPSVRTEEETLQRDLQRDTEDASAPQPDLATS